MSKTKTNHPDTDEQVKLTSKLVTEFGVKKARKAKLEKELNTLTPAIKRAMEDDKYEGVVMYSEKPNDAGETIATYRYAPKDSPYMLEYVLYQQTDVSWKDKFEELYNQLHGPGAFESFCKSLPKHPADKLDCKPNPNYAPPVKKKGGR